MIDVLVSLFLILKFQTMHHFSIKTLIFLYLFILPATQLQAEGCRIPSSKTSQEAYRRVAPRLIREMQGMDVGLGDPVFIRIFKKEKQLEVWTRKGLAYKLFKTYTICDHSGTLGPKIKEGDKQSPEGFYSVGANQLNPYSDYHLSFNLGFPNEFDRSHNRTGSVLMVHGRCSSIGCFAMTDFRMEEIYTIVEAAIIAGQSQVPVHIFPFRMTWENMAAHNNSKWVQFWENLKEGYDYFEGYRSPPLVTVQNKRYHFFTFRPLLFGGNFPAIPADNNYAQLNTASRKTDTL
ncbi:MAG: murein L,D-transpeptidase [Proteobacteria bacterium]|nr:murein L,D-transpeptidase [Pseudomonadota bacterium]